MEDVVIISENMLWIKFFDTSGEIAPRWWSQNTFDDMISQHWFRQWLGVVKQQAITWANVDTNPWHH